jgi:hypothetical protein
VGETEKLISVTGDHRELTLVGLGQSTSPHLLAIGDVTIKVCVRVGTSVVTSPAVGRERGDGVGIAVGRVEILHSQELFRPVGLLIDPGIGTVQQPAAGPSQGQVPQVALDEGSETIRSG